MRVFQFESHVNKLSSFSLSWEPVSHGVNMASGTMFMGLSWGEVNRSQKMEKDCRLGRPSQISLSCLVCCRFYIVLTEFWILFFDPLISKICKQRCILKASRTFFFHLWCHFELRIHQHVVLKYEIYLLSLPNIITHKKYGGIKTLWKLWF